MVKSLFLYLSFFTCFSYAIFGQENKQERFTLMGVGDSITEGSEAFNSYLFPLWQKLFTAGYQFDFVGPRESKCRIGSLNHCGFSGKSIEYIESKIDSIYRIYPADIVLLHAGHNHFSEEKPVENMIASYKSIIHKIQVINPKVYILVAQVIPSGKLPKYAYIPELNKRIEDMVFQYHSDHIRLVDQACNFDWEKYTIEDKVHPNQLGAERMATIWFQALKEILLPSEQTFEPEIVKYKTLNNGDSLTLHIFHSKYESFKGERPTIINFSGHYKIFCVNGNTGFRNESRIFYFIDLQNEEDYERKESSSA